MAGRIGKRFQRIKTLRLGAFFVNEKQGYAVGDRGTILGTMDGGRLGRPCEVAEQGQGYWWLVQPASI